MIPVTNDAYRLMHEGTIALSQIETHGIKIDTKYLTKTIERTGHKITNLSKQLKDDDIFCKWKKRYGQRTNLDSHIQLGKILFDDMKIKCPALTGTGRYKTDIEVLEQVDIPFVRKYLRLAKLKKAKSTYLVGILRETTSDGFLHPVFNLHIPRSYRGSCDHPNFQNIPFRVHSIRKLIRQAFISRSSNHQIVEVDYGGVEVCSSTWYHKDPMMLKYITDPKKDMHRDMAQRCYMLSSDQVTKEIRSRGKNDFVFPQFYGDWYKNCAKNLWIDIKRLNLETVEGNPLDEWLAYKGIKRLGKCDPKEKPRPGTFEYHIQQIEYDFWNKLFKVYNRWRKRWWEQYQQTGSLTMLSGFEVRGYLKRKEVLNYPIQGTAFHCLLWSLTRINKLLRKYKMRSLLIGQIHDSIVADVLHRELNNYLEIIYQVMTKDVRKHWPWIITPLKVEAEVAPPGQSWYEKKTIKILAT